MNHIFALAFGIGVVAGLRSLTAPAAIAWAANLGWLNLEESPFAFMASAGAVAAFSLFAIGELIADKLPQIPKRTALLGLAARILMGGFCGACLCAANKESLFIGAALGVVGAVIGAFGGYEIRKRLAVDLNIRDRFIALSEDIIAIGLAWFLVSR